MGVGGVCSGGIDFKGDAQSPFFSEPHHVGNTWLAIEHAIARELSRKRFDQPFCAPGSACFFIRYTGERKLPG